MKWRYEVDVGSIEGEVEAATEDDAIAATTDDAIRKGVDAIVAGTWEMRQVDDDRP